MQTCPKCKQMIDDDSWFCDQCGTELMVCPNCKAVKRGIRCNTCGTKLISAKDFAQNNGVLGSSTTPPSGGVNRPVGGVQTPAGGVQAPVGGVQSPVGGVQPPTGGMQTPTGGMQTPTGGMQAPTGGMQAPTGGMQAPVGGVQAPVGGAQTFGTSVNGVQQQPTDCTLRPGAQRPQPSRASLPRPDHLVCQSPRLRLGVANGAVIGRRGDYAQAFAGQGFVSGLHARLQFNALGELELVDLGSTNGTFVNGAKLMPNVPKVICIGDNISFAGMVFKAEA